MSKIDIVQFGKGYAIRKSTSYNTYSYADLRDNKSLFWWSPDYMEKYCITENVGKVLRKKEIYEDWDNGGRVVNLKPETLDKPKPKANPKAKPKTSIFSLLKKLVME